MATIRRAEHGERLTFQMANEIEQALGLPLSWKGRKASETWDAIAHATNLPDTEQLKRGMDGPGINALPSYLWNLAAAIAEQRS